MVQLPAPVTYELSKTNQIQFYYLNGPIECPPAIGVAEQFEGPYYRFFDNDAPHITQLFKIARSLSRSATSPEDYARQLRQRGLTQVQSDGVCDFLEREVDCHPDAPFDGVLGFSEGASVAASLILRRAAQGQQALFKFAVFICASLVFRFDSKDAILADETEWRLELPTANIVGSQDPGRHASLTLYNLCDPSSRGMSDHGSGHTIPWGAKWAKIIERMMDSAGLISSGGSDSLVETPTTDSVTRQVMPIAVIGLAGRFPGEAVDAKGLWDLCREGRSAWSEIPESRFSARAYHHPNPSKTGCFNARGAHFLKEDVALFDAQFFGVSPAEAKAMDPQQRLLLEATYEALENAGITLKAIAGHSTGVYVGASQIDYTSLLLGDVQDIPVYQSTGTSANILSNRISYIFDLKGPSLTMDTACSSSLAALHTACQSLRSGEIHQAIVAGAHIMLSPDTMVGMSMLRLFGEDGRSYTYDSRATGYGRGEGVVSLILKPLHDAVRDGDNIRAVIRNTGANQDGRTNGITFPSCDAQANLIKSVYEGAGLDPSETDYVEAHGTGTSAGDPVEAEAIARSLAANRPPDRPLIVGSVKSNIGHLEAASGLAAMVKTILALEADLIPPNFDFQSPNEDIPLNDWRLTVPTAPQPWPNSNIKRASISNFGFGGTNVHVVLEKFDEAGVHYGDHMNGYVHINGNASSIHETEHLLNGYSTDESSKRNGITEDYGPSRRQLFVLSANDKLSLKERARQLSRYVEANPDVDLKRLAFTLNERRSDLEWRQAVSAATSAELREAFNNDGAECSRPAGIPKLGFVFTGQGAQWPSMGHELLVYPSYRQTLYNADQILKSYGSSWSLMDELLKDAGISMINKPIFSQPLTTAVQIALVDLLSTWGIRPAAVVGHSSGEIAAAYAAGALSLADCMLVAYQRGVLAEDLKESHPQRPGGMLAVGASPARVRPMLDRLGSANVVTACVNSPSLVTASGDKRGIERLQTVVEEEKLLNRRLKVDVAYHSPHMKDIAAAYLERLSSVTPQTRTDVEFHSSVKGSRLENSSLNADYWVENMVSPVQFLDGVQSMYGSKAKGPDVLLEIGPHSTLEAPIRDIMKVKSSQAPNIRYIPALVRNKDAALTALSLTGALHVLGADLQLSVINQIDTRSSLKSLSDLPAYPWNHSKRHWHESRHSSNHRHKQFPRHDLLGNLVDDYNTLEPRWKNLIRLADLPWLRDHRVQDSFVFPFTGYLAMVLEAAFQYATLQGLPIQASTLYKLREIKVSRSMVLSEEQPTEVSLVLRPREEGSRALSRSWQAFSIYSWTAENGWIEHCQGLMSLIQDTQQPNSVNGSRHADLRSHHCAEIISKQQTLCQQTLDPKDIYSRFIRGGLQFGPAFQNITSALIAPDHSIGVVTVPNTADSMPHNSESHFGIHPRTFDAFFQVTDLAGGAEHLATNDIHVPTFVRGITVRHDLLHEPGHDLIVYAKHDNTYADGSPDVHSSFLVTKSWDHRDVLIDVEDFVGSKLPNHEAVESSDRGLCHKLDWKPCPDLLTYTQFSALTRAKSDDSQAMEQLQRLEQGAFFYMQRMLRTITQDDLELASPHLQRFHGLLSAMNASSQQKTSPFQTDEWLHCSHEDQEKYLTEMADSDDCGHLLSAIGQNISPIVREEVDPLSIMLGEDKLRKFYRSYHLLNHACEAGGAVVSFLMDQKPNMRILEIGAGTGASTGSILRTLGTSFESYDFTDISPGFFADAKEELKEWGPKISYRRLDIEEDPMAQGFEAGSYDLVIAANVLHATKNISKTLKNVRSLLRPGGKALIGEIVLQLISAALVFGILPGWWLSEEPERQNGPLLTESQWDKVMRENGFSGIDGSIRTQHEGINLGSVMISTAVPQQEVVYPEALIVLSGTPHEQLVEAVSKRLVMTTSQAQVSTSELLNVDMEDKYGVVLAMDDPFWPDLDEQGLQKMQKLFSSARGVLWVSRGAYLQNPAANMATGFARSIRAENAGICFLTLDLDGGRVLSDAEIADTIMKVFKAGFGPEEYPRFFTDFEYIETDGVLHIPRITAEPRKDEFVIRETCAPSPEAQQFIQPGRPLKLKVGQVGLLDSIHFEHDKSLESPLRESEVEIAVASVGMNFKDLMISLGQIPFFHELGVECSGTVTGIGPGVQDLTVGDRVCALAKGCYANRVRTSQYLTVRIPQQINFTYAASIPVIFSTAFYALVEVGRLKKGETVLIHAAAGGVGQAAIMIAQNAEAEVFVTVGSVEKKDLVMKTYDIPEDHVFSSRDTTFQTLIMAMTNDGGVDIVLNSTSGEILHRSWECLAPLGRFLEIGKRDLVQNSNLEMEKFADSATFAAVDLGILSEKRPLEFKRILTEMVEMHSKQILKAVEPLTVFPISELQQAMRMMQTGKHSGKIVIEAREDCIVQALPAPSAKAVDGRDVSYLVTGGTGGLGRSITRWLAREGAKHIVLASRSGMDQKGVPELVDELREMNVNVLVERCDVANHDQVKGLVEKCQATMPPIRGVIHGAMALRDALFEKISYQDWSLNIKPRVDGAWNLHNALMGTDLDFFVMLASGSGLTGQPGQAAYAASNTFLDSFAAYRNHLGLAASVIDIGIVEEVGYVAENVKDRAEIANAAHDRLSEAEFLALVKAAMTDPFQDRSFQQTLTGCKLLPDRPLPHWAHDPKSVHILHSIESASLSGKRGEGSIVVRQTLKQVETAEQATDTIRDALCQRLAGLLLIAAEEVDVKKPIVAYGLDSLAAIELHTWISKEVEANVPLMELMNSPSIEQLAGKIAFKSRLVSRAFYKEEGEAEAGKEEVEREKEGKEREKGTTTEAVDGKVE
ncbi:MAG: hypothetical protein Q9219_006593 [cf. Caloplaca sp. 3 TL-2023]